MRVFGVFSVIAAVLTFFLYKWVYMLVTAILTLIVAVITFGGIMGLLYIFFGDDAEERLYPTEREKEDRRIRRKL